MIVTLATMSVELAVSGAESLIRGGALGAAYGTTRSGRSAQTALAAR